MFCVLMEILILGLFVTMLNTWAKECLAGHSLNFLSSKTTDMLSMIGSFLFCIDYVRICDYHDYMIMLCRPECYVASDH